MANIKLKEARGKISVEQVCKDCGISESAYRKYEEGARIPRDAKKVLLSKYFNVPVSELFFYE